jgi:hypothetical protein
VSEPKRPDDYWPASTACVNELHLHGTGDGVTVQMGVLREAKRIVRLDDASGAFTPHDGTPDPAAKDAADMLGCDFMGRMSKRPS